MSIERASDVDGLFMSTRSSNASAGDPTDDAQDKKAGSCDLIGSRSSRGPRLFSEVFALGCSVAFRWAAVSLFPALHKMIPLIHH